MYGMGFLFAAPLVPVSGSRVCRTGRARWVVRAAQEGLGGNFAAQQQPRPWNQAKIDELLELLDDKDPVVRLRAVVATKDLTNEEAEPVLCKVFDSGESTLQNLYFATMALGYKPNSRSFEILTKLLESDVDPEIRANALAALGYGKEKRAVSTLIHAIYEETHWTAKCAAAVSLGMICDQRAYDSLMAGMDMDTSKADDMKISCIGSLGELGDPRCVSKIVPHADSKNFILRQIVAEALGNLKDPQSVPTLKKLEVDTHDNVSSAATNSLARLAAMGA